MRRNSWITICEGQNANSPHYLFIRVCSACTQKHHNVFITSFSPCNCKLDTRHPRSPTSVSAAEQLWKNYSYPRWLFPPILAIFALPSMARWSIHSCAATRRFRFSVTTAIVFLLRFFTKPRGTQSILGNFVHT